MDPVETFFLGLAGAMVPVAVFLAREWGKGKKQRDVKKAAAEAEVTVIQATAAAEVTTIAAEAAATASKLEAEAKKEITGVHNLQAQADLKRAVTDEKRAAAEQLRLEEEAITKKQLKSWIDELRGDLNKCEENRAADQLVFADLKSSNEACEKRSLALSEELLGFHG